MAKSHDPGLDNKPIQLFAYLPVLNNKLPFLLAVDRAPELFFQVLTFSEKTLRRMLGLFGSPSGQPMF